MDKEKLIKALEADPNLNAAILFGSQTKGYADARSDIDIALLYDQHKVPEALALLQMRESLSDYMEQQVDIVLLNNASPIIAMQAIKNGVPLLIRNEKTYRAFEVRLITDYADLKKLRQPFEKNILQRKIHD